MVVSPDMPEAGVIATLVMVGFRFVGVVGAVGVVGVGVDEPLPPQAPTRQDSAIARALHVFNDILLVRDKFGLEGSCRDPAMNSTRGGSSLERVERGDWPWADRRRSAYPHDLPPSA
jgi:hypothetical protein